MLPIYEELHTTEQGWFLGLSQDNKAIRDSIQYWDALEWSQKPYNNWNSLRTATGTKIKWGENRLHVICARVLTIVKFCGFCTSTHNNDRDGESGGQSEFSTHFTALEFCQEQNWWRQSTPRDSGKNDTNKIGTRSQVQFPLGVVTGPASMFR